MSLPLGILPLEIRNWEFTNAHDNFTQRLRKGASFDLTVSDPEFKAKFPTFKDKYNQTTKNLQWLIRHAIDNKTRLRAMGSGWSLSKVAVCEDGIINTKKLRLKAELSRTQVSKEYLNKGGDPGNLLFAQCGNTVIEINELLEKVINPRKSLRASGGSNGQTIVGALSTGTHGAAFKFGSLSEFVVGLHIVVGPDRHVWLEKASHQVTSEEFRSWMGAEVIIDDDMFNSALVSFGSFGIIHGILIEVEPKFLLEQQLQIVPYDAALINAITEADFSGLKAKLKYPDDLDNKLYHFELAINPHTFQKNNSDPDKGVYLRVMYKIPYYDGYPPFEQKVKGHTYGDDVAGLIQLVLDIVEALPGKLEMAIIPKTVNALFKAAYDRPETAIGTVGETFRNTIFRGKLFSAAFSFNREIIPELIDIILAINGEIPFGGVMAMRFVKGTKATLGFAKFPNTCVLELDGVDAKINHKFSEELVKVLESKNIPYAVHWGKINGVLNKERVRKIYGQKVDQWLDHRKQLLTNEVRDVFNNGFLEQCGLDQWTQNLVNTPV